MGVADERPKRERALRMLTRVGLASKGVVYLLMGLLALLAALGRREGQLGDKRESIHRLTALPGGRVLLFVIAVGLLAYVLLRIVQGIFDTQRKGTRYKGVLRRIGFVVNGLLYVGLVGYAFHAALSGGPSRSARETETAVTAEAMRHPGGNGLVVFLGVFIIGIAGYQVYQAWTGGFHVNVATNELGAKRRIFVYRLGQLGYAARAVVMGVVGSTFVRAGVSAHASAVGGTGEAFDLLRDVGAPILGAVAAGLMAYGAYALVQAIHPHERPDEPAPPR